MQELSNLSDIDNEWGNFCDGGDMITQENIEDTSESMRDAPKCSDIYISTKTKIAYLNNDVDLTNVFGIFLYLNIMKRRKELLKNK